MENDPGHQLVRGHTYSNIISQDQAQVHIGDKHNYGNSSTHNHTYYLCTSTSEQSSQFLTLCGHGGIATNGGELVSLKRRRSSNGNEYKHKLDKEESLEHALSKLGKLSKSIQDQRIGKDARKIIRRIALAIDAVKKQQAGLPGHSNAKSFTYMSHDKSDLKNIRKNLKIAGRVDVNTGFRRAQNTKVTRLIRKYDKVAFEQWEISLKTVEVESRNSDGTEVIDSLITLYLEPRISGSGLPVTVHFGETKTHTGVSFINPVILAYRIVPENSEVFKMIRNDDLEGLKSLLADGKATIRDCDEYSATLLHHACTYGSPRCCQYLVHKGADIESIASSQETPLSLCALYGDSPEYLDTLYCGKILLKSGADPTFDHDDIPPPVIDTLRDNAILLESILVEGRDFLDLQNFRRNGLGLWLSACERTYQNTARILQKLKVAGCNIEEKDDNGWNCLFYSVLTSRGPETSYGFEGLRYVLSVFDDIYARDAKGRTIFDRLDKYQHTHYGGYRRDLWYCALERAGIDVSPHLVQHPRVPSYESRYTPEHYHALKHLQSWDNGNFRSQMDRLLQEIPLDEDEALEMERLRRRKSKLKHSRRDRLKAYLDDDSESDDDSGTSRQSESSDQLKGNDQSRSLAGLA